MTLDDAKADWGAQAPGWALADDDVIALVKSEAKRFDREVRRRDWRELIAGAVGLAMIAPTTIHGSLLTRLGALVLIAGCGVIVVKLHRARRVAGADRVDAPVAELIRAERSKVEAQIHLLESVLWWYVAPIAIGSIMVFAGLAGASWATFVYAVLTAVLSWGVCRLNASAARSHLRPRREELSRLLAQVADAPDAET